MKNTKIIVISLGGSIIVPGNINISFLRKFKSLVETYAKKDHRFVIVAGGGKTCRQYQDAASKVTKLHKEDLDWLGIHATRLNAHLLRTIFRKHASPYVLKDPTSHIIFEHKILIASGWKPGWSTDYDTVLLAKRFGAKTVINLSNMDYVYNKDPSKYKDAKPIKTIRWRHFMKLVGEIWKPGMNVPFDPVASRAAEEAGIHVIMLKGTDLKNLKHFLDGKKFKGTVIS